MSECLLCHNPLLCTFQYEIKLPVTMIAKVIDVNDPPVFANLPSEVTLPEVRYTFHTHQILFILHGLGLFFQQLNKTLHASSDVTAFYQFKW